MRKVVVILLLMFCFYTISHSQKGNKVLLLIDIQDFYFPGGRSALVEPEKAAANAARLLDNFRKEGRLRGPAAGQE